VFLQSDAVDEVEVGIKNLLRGVSAEHANEQRHDTFNNQRVTLGFKHNDALLFLAPSYLLLYIVGLQPHPTLATVDEIALYLVLFF